MRDWIRESADQALARASAIPPDALRDGLYGGNTQVTKNEPSTEPDYDAIARRRYEALVQSATQRKREYLESPEFAAKFNEIFNGDLPVSTVKPLPKYLCHKEVRALKIKDVVRQAGKYLLSFEEDGYPAIEVTNAWVDRFGPKSGSYYVVYDDDYTSISPAKAFEEGYTRQPD